MSEQDNLPAGDQETPRDMTSNELDEALRWLEELAGKQGKSLDGLVTLDDAALEDSPFKGLFDSEEQELPDWLREVPSLAEDGDALLEGESRLDWLARMANRESVEELPTLEWRRLTGIDDDEDGDLVDAMPEAAAAIAGLPEVESSVPDAVAAADVVAVEQVVEADEPAAAPANEEPDTAPAVVLLMTQMAEEDAAAAPAAEEEPSADSDVALPASQSEPVVMEAPVSDPSLDESESDVMAIEMGDIAGSSPDDLDEAMAWLEELAASQDTPIEDLPSVADRALASKLIAEAASGASVIDGLDISELGIAMSGIYVGKTKLAPTGPLVGQGPADVTPDSAIHAEMILATETDSYDTEEADRTAEASEVELLAESVAIESEPDVAVVVEEVVASEEVIPEPDVVETVVLEEVTLDEAVPEEVVVEETLVVEEVVDDEVGVDDVVFDDDFNEAVIDDAPTEDLRVEPLLVAAALTEDFSEQPTDAFLQAEPSLAALIKDTPHSLPELLSAVDRLAVPAAITLNEIGALLASDQTAVKITPYSLESTLDWLEGSASGQPATVSLDASLVAAMPDDPDEAQVWLEQLAGEPTEINGSEPLMTITDAAVALDISDADLLDMPEDPDAAIAWIESLAAKRERADS